MKPTFLVFGIGLTSATTLAATLDFAQCQPGVLGPQKIHSQSQNLTDPQRLAELDQLLVDFRAIRQGIDDNRRVPSGFLENCFNSKKEMVQQHYTKLSPTAQKSHRALKAMAQILDVSLEPQEAVTFYAAAYEVSPGDTDSALRGLKMYAGLAFQNLAQNEKTLTQEQKIAILMELLQRAYAIADNPKFSRDERTWALEQVQGALGADALRAQIEEPYWKRFLSIDPGSDTALRNLMAIYQQRADYSKMAFYASKLSSHSKVQESDIGSIGIAFLKSEDFSSLLKVGVELSGKFPQNPETWGYLGIAEQKLKLHDKATEHLQKAIKLKSKNISVKSTYATLLEDLGDQDSNNKNWLEAMAKYRAALSHNPNSSQLKKKTAYLILDYYTESKFPQNASTTKDMDYALDLMKSALESKVPLMADFAAGIQLAQHSSNRAKHMPLCDRYQSDRPSGLTLDLVRACVSIYRSAGAETKAKQLVDLALSKMANPPAKQELLKTLR